MSLNKVLLDKLNKRQEQGLLRSLKPLREDLVDFSSNDYLGLARNKDLQALIDDKYKSVQNKSNGSGGSRLLAGNYPQIENLEHLLSKTHNKESALVFNSGYNANLAVFSTIPQKGDIVLYDEYIHACVKDGLRLGLSKHYSFKHNSIEDLEKKLIRFKENRVFIAIEGIYSMDGDLAPLREISLLAERYNAYIIIDEAHSTGIYGENGSGLVSQLGLDSKVFIKVHTFGKAIGVHGAVVTGSKVITDYLINYARSFIYTTSMTPHTTIAVTESYKYIADNPEVQSDLFNKIRTYKSISEDSTNESPIQHQIIGDNFKVKNLTQDLINKGFNAFPVLSPTVPEGTERIRICLHSYNTYEEIKTFVESIKKGV